MPKLAILCGTLLVIVGLTGSLVAMSMVDKWWYASIPAVIGILLAICGWTAVKIPGARSLTLLLAIVIAAIGVVGSFMPSGLNFSAPGSVAFISSIFRLLTIIICTSFAFLAARSLLKRRL